MYRSFVNAKHAEAKYAANDTAYDDYEAISLLGDDGPKRHLVPNAAGVMEYGTCTRTADEGLWRAIRIGPRQSTGGNDWWTVGLSDVFELRALMDQHEAVGLLAHWSHAVDGGDALIPLPPLHMHHTHLVNSNGGLWAGNIVSCVLHGTHCPDLAGVIMHHGDQQNAEKDGGALSTASVRYSRDGVQYVRMLKDASYFTPLEDDELTLFQEMNDVRPAGSSPMTWWYQAAALVAVDDTARSHAPLSFHTAYQPIIIDLFGKLGRFLTSYIPPHEDHVQYYTQRMPYKGTLVDGTAHFHQTGLQKAFLYTGVRPEALGLGGRADVLKPTYRLWSPQPYHALHTADVLRALGLPVHNATDGANNAVFHAHVLNQDVAGQALRCWATASTAVLGGKVYDRAPKVECLPWSWARHEVYTSVTYLGSSTLRDADFAVHDRDGISTLPAGFPTHGGRCHIRTRVARS